MFKQFKAIVRARSRTLYVATSVALIGVLTGTLSPGTAFAAPKDNGYKVPCNDFLSKPASAATDPIAGAFIGLRPVAFVVMIVLFFIGAIMGVFDIGKKILKWAALIGGALLGFAILVSFGTNLDLNKGC